jgi:putative protease
MSFGALHAVRAQAAEALVEALSAPQPGVSYAGCDTAQRWVREVARLREAYAASSTRLSAMPEKNEKAARAGEGVRELPLHAAVSALAGSRAQKSQVQEVALAAELCVRVISVEQAQAAVAEGAERLYVPGDVVLLAGAAALEPAGGAAAAQKCGEQAAFERLARAGYAAFTQVAGAVPVVVELDDVCREADVPRQDALMAVAACVAAGNVSEVALLEGQGQPFEVTEAIPVHNSRAALAFEAAGATALWLDQELTLEQIAQIAAGSGAALGIALWGHTRTMLTEHCVLTVAGACGQACESCGLRHRKLFLKNIDNKLLPVTTDIHGRSHIYWADPTDLVPDLEKLLLAGVGRVRIDGTLATPEALAGEVKRARRALERLRHGGAGKRPGRERGAHAGHLTGGVA